MEIITTKSKTIAFQEADVARARTAELAWRVHSLGRRWRVHPHSEAIGQRCCALGPAAWRVHSLGLIVARARTRSGPSSACFSFQRATDSRRVHHASEEGDCGACFSPQVTVARARCTRVTAGACSHCEELIVALALALGAERRRVTRS
ncbi:hypothetical protein CYMTET_45344 [Cymbomonas tetramitiformis]|uniref:Uncharacterized protein n=1 Tax=Cymbomonas tetramitiformis TaxID=36881 RepID=A0AAE0BYF2_9CHLO|nr:hypothetical protein CYMTET_45344 [Cymbomonas tetramitiformis]